MIPKVAHFIWYGASFPWMNALALQSAHDHGELERVVLHFDGQVDGALLARLQRAMPRLALRPIDSARVFAAVDATAGNKPALGPRLKALYAELKEPPRAPTAAGRDPVQRSGVYLDIATVTIAPLTPL